MGGLKSLAEALLITIVFAFFIMSFAINFLEKQAPDADALSAEYGLNDSRASTQASMQDFEEFSNTTKSMLGDSEPNALEFVFLIFEAAMDIPKLFIGLVIGGLSTITTILYLGGGADITQQGWTRVLGVAIGVITIIVVIRLVLYIVSAIRTGSSER